MDASVVPFTRIANEMGLVEGDMVLLELLPGNYRFEAPGIIREDWKSDLIVHGLFQMGHARQFTSSFLLWGHHHAQGRLRSSQSNARAFRLE